MKSMMALTLMLFGTSVLAQDEGAYVGFGLGWFDYEESDFGFVFSDSAPAARVYGGYRFTETWAFEASYSSTADIKDAPFGFPVSANYDILEVRGLAHLGAFLVGLGYWDADISASAFGLSVSDSDSGASAIFGGEWAKNSWSFRIEYELFDTESSVDAAVLGFGAHYRF